MIEQAKSLRPETDQGSYAREATTVELLEERKNKLIDELTEIHDAIKTLKFRESPELERVLKTVRTL